jgi:ACS family tartrate transporter-like MFS transporter
MNDEAREKVVINKVSRRLVPYVGLAFLLCMVDRTNISFAALTMNKELGFTATFFGWGAGIFFVAYFFFEVPSNLALRKFGARIWIGRIMISWGIVSAAMALVSGKAGFLSLRFLLGVAEAGFFPGIVFYLTDWFPEKHRAVVLSRFYFAQPAALIVSATLSGMILKLNGFWGIAGWRWLFVAEGFPTVIMGLITFFYLTDKPAAASWLEPGEREWLQGQIDEEHARVQSVHKLTLWLALGHPRVLLLGLVLMGVVVCQSGTVMFLPQMVKALGNFSSSEIGFIVAIPYTAAAIGMLIIGYSSDRRRERKYHLLFSMLLIAVGMLCAAVFHTSVTLTILGITMVAIGYFSAVPIFYILPSTFLVGTASAGGIALINSIGNLGGFFAQAGVGWLKDRTGAYSTGLVLLAVAVTTSAIVAFMIWLQIEKMRRAASQGQLAPEARSAESGE